MKPLKEFIKSTDLKIVLVALLYYVSAQLGIWLSFPISKSMVLWPPEGIALALMIIYGRKIWPAITIGALIANALVILHLSIPFSMNALVAMIAIAGGNTLEAIIGSLLIEKVIKTKNPFQRTKDVFSYLGIALIICFVGSGIGTGAMFVNGLVPSQGAVTYLLQWWLSNVVSVLIVTPFIIACTQKFTTELSMQRLLEWGVFAGALFVILSVLYYNPESVIVARALPFLIVPFLLWLGFRFNLQTTTVGILAVSFIAIYFTIRGLGPFVLDVEFNSLLLVQIFIALVGISTIILYATVHERKEAELAMTKFNESLESKVKERTKELNEEIAMHKRTEKKMKTSNSKLRKANVELDNFVYSVSHDLRAPIASVLGLVNLAKSEKDIEMMRNYVKMIGESAEQQDSFIKDILDLSRNDRQEVAKEEIDFEPMINEIFDQLKHSSKDANVVKMIEIDQQKAFLSDQRRLKVIFNNLISNSIRYSHDNAPQIKIDIKVNEATAKIRINDKGVGIPKEHLKNVFDMFYRANDDNAGSGLGLYIVKETVEKLRGNVELNSQENEGTTVSLEIPNLSLN